MHAEGGHRRLEAIAGEQLRDHSQERGQEWASSLPGLDLELEGPKGGQDAKVGSCGKGGREEEREGR